jgi:hypothetical protein
MIEGMYPSGHVDGGVHPKRVLPTPPHVHVHVGSADWEARFEFSFWRNRVRLWDVVPVKIQPSVAVLEGLRQA